MKQKNGGKQETGLIRQRVLKSKQNILRGMAKKIVLENLQHGNYEDESRR